MRRYWPASIPFALLLAVVGLAAWRSAGPRVQPAAEPQTPAEVAAAVQDHFHVLRDNPEDADGAVVLTEEVAKGYGSPWNGTVLIEEDGHAAKNEPVLLAGKGEVKWQLDRLRFYGDTGSVRRVKAMLGY